MSIFYIQRKFGSKVEEIRRIVKINGAMKFIVDRKGSVKFVSPQEFISIPYGYTMTKIK
jgi:hypothetical protein